MTAKLTLSAKWESRGDYGLAVPELASNNQIPALTSPVLRLTHFRAVTPRTIEVLKSSKVHRIVQASPQQQLPT